MLNMIAAMRVGKFIKIGPKRRTGIKKGSKDIRKSIIFVSKKKIFTEKFTL
jgi:hypothetical protein